MTYLTGYTEAEADHWGGVFLEMATIQLGTVAQRWGKIQLTDGTWAVPIDETRQGLVVIPVEMINRLAQRISEGRVKSWEELIASGLILVDEEAVSHF